MANRDCNGDIFIAKEHWFYRCLWDGIAIKKELKNGDECPNCHRKIDAHYVGKVEIETAEFAILPEGVGRVELP